MHANPRNSECALPLSTVGVKEVDDTLAAGREAHAVQRQLILLDDVLVVGAEGPRRPRDHHLRQQARRQTCGGAGYLKT